jgi:hypothetical protein
MLEKKADYNPGSSRPQECAGTRKDLTNANATSVGSGKDTAPAVSTKSANGKILTTSCVTRNS